MEQNRRVTIDRVPLRVKNGRICQRKPIQPAQIHKATNTNHERLHLTTVTNVTPVKNVLMLYSKFLKLTKGFKKTSVTGTAKTSVSDQLQMKSNKIFLLETTVYSSTPFYKSIKI
jgi:hypothetical protein